MEESQVSLLRTSENSAVFFLEEQVEGGEEIEEEDIDLEEIEERKVSSKK